MLPKRRAGASSKRLLPAKSAPALKTKAPISARAAPAAAPTRAGPPPIKPASSTSVAPRGRQRTGISSGKSRSVAGFWSGQSAALALGSKRGSGVGVVQRSARRYPLAAAAPRLRPCQPLRGGRAEARRPRRRSYRTRAPTWARRRQAARAPSRGSASRRPRRARRPPSQRPHLISKGSV